MTNNHIDDTNIQRIVLQNLHRDSETIAHIEHCDVCKAKAEQYKLMIDLIKQQRKPAFDFNLSELVLAQIKPTPKYAQPARVVYLLVLVGFVSFGIVFYQFGISILDLFSGSSGIIISMLFLAICSVSFLHAIEIYKKYQRKMDALNFY